MLAIIFRYDFVFGSVLMQDIDMGFSVALGWTALFWAIRCGSYTSLNISIDRGAAVSTGDVMRGMPVHWALEAADDEILGTILTAEADPHSAIGLRARTPYNKASKVYDLFRHQREIELLIYAGADVVSHNAKGGRLHLSRVHLGMIT